LNLRPLDDAARDGRYQLLLSEGDEFAVARWTGARWQFSSGIPLHFEPAVYHRPDAGHG
jgi:hypothetical protein